MEKKQIRQAVHTAIRKGKITKRTTCQTCGIGGNLEMHHADYEKPPLEVIWLCRYCHVMADGRRRDREEGWEDTLIMESFDLHGLG